MTKQETDLSEIKEKMKSYTDFFGGQFIDKQLIDNAETLTDLERVFQDHHDYITDMATDAQRNLKNFKHSIGVY